MWKLKLKFLLAIALLVTSCNSEPTKPKAKLLSHPVQSITSFTVSNFLKGLFFQKKDDGTWTVERYHPPLVSRLGKQLKDPAEEHMPRPADLEKVVFLLTTFATTELDEPVSTKTKLQRYEISEDSLRIHFVRDRGPFSGLIAVGKRGEDMRSCYVVKTKAKYGISSAQTGPVHWVQKDLRTLLTQPYEYWLADTKK